MLECFEEHLVTRSVIGTFNSLAVDDERWPAKLKVLSRLFRHHVEEVEHELFKLAHKLLENDRCLEILGRVQEFKREFKES